MADSVIRRRMGRLAVSATAVLSLLYGSAGFVRADEPEEAVKIFQQVKPTIVSISNDEGSGTGILLNKDGLILTCAHVVVSPQAYQVKVDLGGDDDKEAIYKHVQIVGYHPERDLALIKIDPKENPNALMPAEISKDKASPGQRIYAIGDPGAGDKVMAKTITQGIVSGVDREFNQQKFYQIDAAINPGNSGGPVVDHTGKVVGLVDFQFQGKQALNFAIPLRDLDTTKFGPLTNHKAEPEQSEELMRQAQFFADAAVKARDEEGPDSPAYKMYTAYAAYCYSIALECDPANPDIYVDIGTQFIAMQRYEAASAYLVRAVELRPWGPLSGMTYHELGVAWMRQGQADKAMAAWKEGAAKFPYAAVLYDDESVYYMEKKEYAHAAYSASVALAAGARKARITPLQHLLRDARAKLDDTELDDLKQKVDHDTLCADLEKLRVKSNSARKRKSLYMVAAFVDIMKQVGTLDVPGVEDKISQTPLKAPARLTVGGNPDDEDDTPTESTDSAIKKKHKPAPETADAGGEDKAPDDGLDDGGDSPKKHKPADIASADDPNMVPGMVPTPAPHRKAKPADEDSPDDQTPPKKGGQDESATPAAPDPDEPKSKVAPHGPRAPGGDDWLGGGSKKKGAASADDKSADEKSPDDKSPGDAGKKDRPAPVTVAPQPSITGLDLAGAVTTVDDAKVIPLDVDKQEVADAVLSADGGVVYVLHKDGLLRKVTVPSLKEDRQLDLGSECMGMGMTRDGLAVAVKSAQEIWLISPTTLEVKRRVPMVGVTRIATSPASSMIFASSGPDDLELIDMLNEEVLSKFTPKRLSALATGGPKIDLSIFTMSPDGQFLLCPGNGGLCQFLISGEELKFVALGPALASDPKQIAVSADSRYVALLAGSGNPLLKNDGKTTTYVFKITDLTTPIMTLDTTGACGQLQFDGVAHQLYTATDKKQLSVFAPSGEKIKDYQLIDVKDAGTKRLLVHPSGRSLLVLTAGQLQWVTLP